MRAVLPESENGIAMNPVVFVHLIVALLIIGASMPLIQRRVKMNHWYGFRIRAAFASEERWYAINEYGGRLFFRWGVVLGLTALGGMWVEREEWIAYNLLALCVVIAGPAIIVVKVTNFARKSD